MIAIILSIGRRHNVHHLEQRLNHMEHLLRLIAEKMEIELDKISTKDIEIVKLAEQGKKIAAIKRARYIYGFGLKEAKEYVEKLERMVHR
jgi:ribosomal protein L7/L12